MLSSQESRDFSHERFKEQVTIIGTGTMGHSIALSVFLADFPGIIYGLNDNEIQQAITGIENKAFVLKGHSMMDEAKKKQHSLSKLLRKT